MTNNLFKLNSLRRTSIVLLQQNVRYSSDQNTQINFGIMFVPQQEAWVVERMGKFNKILQPVRSNCYILFLKLNGKVSILKLYFKRA